MSDRVCSVCEAIATIARGSQTRADKIAERVDPEHPIDLSLGGFIEGVEKGSRLSSP